MSYKEIFSNIYENHGFGFSKESRSGPGSTLDETKKLREEIYMTLKNYPYEDVKDILEAGTKSKNETIRKEAIKLLR